MIQTALEQITYEMRQRFVQKLLESQFGPLPPAVLQRLETWPGEQLEELGIAVLKADSLQSLGLTE